MTSSAKLGLTVGAFLVTWGGSLVWYPPRIEQALRTQAQEALSSRGFEAISVDVDGRDLHLVGTVRYGVERQRAEKVASVDGVRRVTSALRVGGDEASAARPAIAPRAMEVRRMGGGAVRARVASAEDEARVRALTVSLLGGEGTLTRDGGSAPDAVRLALGLRALSALEDGVLRFRDDGAFLGGRVREATHLPALRAMIDLAAAPGTGALSVSGAWQARDVGVQLVWLQDTPVLDGLVPDAGARRDLLAGFGRVGGFDELVDETLSVGVSSRTDWGFGLLAAARVSRGQHGVRIRESLERVVVRGGTSQPELAEAVRTAVRQVGRIPQDVDLRPIACDGGELPEGVFPPLDGDVAAHAASAARLVDWLDACPDRAVDLATVARALGGDEATRSRWIAELSWAVALHTADLSRVIDAATLPNQSSRSTGGGAD